MTIFKRLFSILFCIIFCFSCTVLTSAAQIPTITVSDISAMPGDTVKIKIDISNNPGIMAMAFCVTYDSDALVYKTYSPGYLTDYKLYDHSDKGHISFVNVENEDVATDGMIISLSFDVKKDAAPGKHEITIANSNREKYGTDLKNSFSNSNQDFVPVKVVNGAVNVQENCENSGHSFGEWNVIKEAGCTETGLKKHFCILCGKEEKVEIPVTHSFEDEWTIDKAATPTQQGVMSRHCKNCDAVTDKISFDYEEVGGDISDGVSGENPPDESQNSQPTESPSINNTVGEKVPLQEAEKLNGYQQIIKPNTLGSSTNSDESSGSDTPSKSETDSSDTPSTSSDSSVLSDRDSYKIKPIGIVITAICAILSVGIIALCVILIIKHKKQ